MEELASRGCEKREDALVVTTNKLNKTSIIPMAIPGCAFSFPFRTFCLLILSDKTSVSLALVSLDLAIHKATMSIIKKNRASVYQKCGRPLAQKKTCCDRRQVCFISFYILNFLLNYSYDRNNHLKQHHQFLRDATSKVPQPVCLLVLN